MERIPEHKILEFHPDTLLRVRESCGLETAGRVDEAINLLQDWVAKQEHFLKKDFPRAYLETTIVTAKGSVERAKRQLDMVCSMRTFVPQMFCKLNAKNDFSQLHKVGPVVVLPKMTEDNCRVFVLKQSGKYYEHFHTELFQFGVILSEYLKLHDYFKALIFILDARNINALEFLSHVNLIEFSNALRLFVKGYGARVKAMHGVVNSSKAADVFLAVFKQFISPKILSRINVHMSLEELHRHLPKQSKHILPEDLGGEERSIDTLYDEWLDVYSSEEHVRHMREMQEARTDESRRSVQLDDGMFGLPGTFRELNID